MAILNKIRKRSVFLIAIIALALFSFVLSSVFKNGGFSTNKSRRTLATINGEDIDQQDFARKVESQTSRYGGQMTTTRAQSMVWDQELRRVLLQGQMEGLGIGVEQDRLNKILREALQDQPQFQDANGVYSEAKMHEYVATLKATNQNAYEQWVNYEDQLGKNEEELIYFNLIKAGLGATLSEGKMAYGLENNKRDIQFVQIPYTSIPDNEAEVSKSDIEEYINNHKSEYETEASRNIRFVKFNEDATRTDEDAIEKEVASYKDNRSGYNSSTKTNDTIQGLKNTENPAQFVNEFSDLPFADRYYSKTELPKDYQDKLFALNKGEVYGPYKDNGFYKISKAIEVKQLPDSVKSSHILLPYVGLQNAGDVTRTKAQSKALADSLEKVIKADPSKMAALAKEFSADPGSATKGGDLGYSVKNRFVKPFNDYVFENKKGDVGVVESQFGYHVIKIDDQKNFEKAIKFATVAKEIAPSQKTINDIFNKTTKFEMAVSGDKQKFSDIATKDNYTVRPVNNIKALDENIPGEGSQREIVRWAFNEDTKTGDIKRFNSQSGYMVVQLTKKTKKGLMPVEEASARVTPILRNKKKAEIIKSKISGTDLKAVASANKVNVQSASAINLKNPTIAGVGTEPKVVGAVFGLKENVLSEPIIGEKGIYLVKVTKIDKARELDNYASLAIQRSAANRASVNTEVVKALKDNAEIEDHRAKFY